MGRRQERLRPPLLLHPLPGDWLGCEVDIVFHDGRTAHGILAAAHAEGIVLDDHVPVRPRQTGHSRRIPWDEVRELVRSATTAY